jgi:hypothetical protein
MERDSVSLSVAEIWQRFRLVQTLVSGKHRRVYQMISEAPKFLLF